MIKSKFKRVTSLFLATLMCVTTFAGIGSTTAYAASGEKADVYMVDFPRDGDANYDGVWGHSNLTLKNGWHTGRSNFTNLKAIGSYSGNVAYCIEPGISLKVGQTMNKYDENYFNNLAANGVISGDEIRLFVGRILQYGYAILFIRGERPIMDFKYDIMKHPNVALTTDGKASPYKHGEVTKDIASIAIWDIDPATLPEKEMEETNWELLSDEEMEALFINNQTN